MRIVFLTYVPNPTYHTAEEWLERIRPSLPILGEMTSVAEVINIHSLGFKGTEVNNGVKHFFYRYSRLELLFPFALNYQAEKIKPDAVIVRGLIFPWQVILLRWQLGKRVKIVAQHHAEKPLRWPKNKLQYLADRFIGCYFFASRELAEPWVRTGQISDEKKIVEALVISSVFSPTSRSSAKQVTQVLGQPVYLWIGGLDSNKDPLTLVAAFRDFVIQEPGAKLYIIYQDEQLIEKVRMAISECEAIVLVGKVRHQQLQDWFNSADFIISTSHYEGSGTAVCEGISCGCIPILSAIPSFHWMTRGWQIGFHFSPGDKTGLLAALLASRNVDIDFEREKVQTLYKEHLSAAVNAKRMLDSISSLK